MPDRDQALVVFTPPYHSFNRGFSCDWVVAEIHGIARYLMGLQLPSLPGIDQGFSHVGFRDAAKHSDPFP